MQHSQLNRHRGRKKSGFKKNSSQALFFQPKLTINEPNDIYEKEADAVAKKVMRMPDRNNESLFFQPKPIPLTHIQRKCATCENEEKLYRKVGGEEEEENIQMKVETGAAGGMTAPSIVHDAINSQGQPLDIKTRNFMESRLGYDFGDVRVHNDSLAHQSSSEINALAYTHGNHVVFRKGHYQPQTKEGKQLIAHELSHVIQQQNKITPNISRKILTDEQVGGCGVCDKNYTKIGNDAHTIIQDRFLVEYPDYGKKEFPFTAAARSKGRLDLAYVNPTTNVCLIGEIKPANEKGYSDGKKDMTYYMTAVKDYYKTNKKMQVRRMNAWIEDSHMPFSNPQLEQRCQPQYLNINIPENGVYGYYCKKPRSVLEPECKCGGEDKETYICKSIKDNGSIDRFIRKNQESLLTDVDSKINAAITTFLGSNVSAKSLCQKYYPSLTSIGEFVDATNKTTIQSLILKYKTQLLNDANRKIRQAIRKTIEEAFNLACAGATVLSAKAIIQKVVDLLQNQIAKFMAESSKVLMGEIMAEMAQLMFNLADEFFEKLAEAMAIAILIMALVVLAPELGAVYSGVAGSLATMGAAAQLLRGSGLPGRVLSFLTP